MPVFTLRNSSYRQLTDRYRDSVSDNSTFNHESVFDEQEEVGTTTVLADSYLAKNYDEYKYTAAVTETIRQRSSEPSNLLQNVKQEVDDRQLTKRNLGKFSCTKCDKTVGKLSFLAIHQRTHNNQVHFICPECQFIFHTLDDLSSHCQKHSMIQVQCPKCAEYFEDSRLFKTHLGIHIIEIEGNHDEIRAFDDDYPDIDRAMLYNDIYYLNEMIQVKSLGISSCSYAESFLCPYCSVKCTSKVRLCIHILSHKVDSSRDINMSEKSCI